MKWISWIVSRTLWHWIFRLFIVGLFLGFIVLIPIVITLISWSKDLPSVEVLSSYKPPVTTRVHAGDGKLIAEFARESRVFVPIEIVPERVKYAFIDSEDKNFYHHNGVDYIGTAKAVVRTIRAKLNGSGGLFGGSSITQQVAKNFLVGDDRDLRRKWREALIAHKMERLYSKDQILELYLNDNYMGNRSYGVGAAALNYFGKSLEELTLSEIAYLGGVVQRPSRLDPIRHKDQAIQRRNYVIDRMLIRGHVTAEEAQAAKEEALTMVPRLNESQHHASEYFVEEIRRELVKNYGESVLYDGGLSVRTTVDTGLQMAARRALRTGLEEYDRRNGYRGPVDRLDISGTDWVEGLKEIKVPGDLETWEPAVILSLGQENKGPVVGLRGGDEATFSESAKAFLASSEVTIERGDVVYVSATGSGINAPGSKIVELKQVPSVNGALLAMDPHTGRVLAMMGGFSFAQSQFNRATQANRQPGSAFKPFVYAAALDNGYTPSSRLLDTPFVNVDPHTGKVYKPKNYTQGWLGEATMRVGLEQSRNMMTVRLARDIGMDKVVDYGINFNIYDQLQPYLPMSLGAGETTLERLTAAYGMIVNGGKEIKPVIIDRIQDRDGKTVVKSDERNCGICNQSQYLEGRPPNIADERRQVVDPITAYQVVAMMRGVVQRGTGSKVSKVNKTLAGKTGTTNEYRDAWFVGFSPDLVVGVYVGFDQPMPMGSGQGGGIVAAPIFRDFMKFALAKTADTPFRIPSGVRLVRIDAKTGEIANADSRVVLLEPFRPGTEPRRDRDSGFWESGGNGEYDENGGNSKFGYGVDFARDDGDFAPENNDIPVYDSQGNPLPIRPRGTYENGTERGQQNENTMGPEQQNEGYSQPAPVQPQNTGAINGEDVPDSNGVYRNDRVRNIVIDASRSDNIFVPEERSDEDEDFADY